MRGRHGHPCACEETMWASNVIDASRATNCPRYYESAYILNGRELEHRHTGRQATKAARGAPHHVRNIFIFAKQFFCLPNVGLRRRRRIAGEEGVHGGRRRTRMRSRRQGRRMPLASVTCSSNATRVTDMWAPGGLPYAARSQVIASPDFQSCEILAHRMAVSHAHGVRLC